MEDPIWVVFDPYQRKPVYWGSKKDCVSWVMREDPQHASGMHAREAYDHEDMLYRPGGLLTNDAVRMIAETIADRENVPVAVVGKRMSLFIEDEYSMWDWFVSPMIDKVQDALLKYRRGDV